MELCSFKGCGRPIENQMRALCGWHYRQHLKGVPLKAIVRPATSLTQYFWERIDKTGDCWEWTGTLSSEGYGYGCFKRKRHYAHRISYQINVGRIPEGMLLDHACHNRACVKPDHLRLADKKLNAENYSGLMAHNTSGARGVHWHSQSKKWHVQVTHNGKRHAGGLHLTVAEAEVAARDLRNSLHTFNELDRMPA